MENLEIERNTSRENNENDLLLNAIRNKFAAKTTSEAASFSPPKFTIPTLKIASGKSEHSSTISGSPLNDFLLKQLQDKGAKQNGFVLPDLQQQPTFASVNMFEIPMLKTNSINDTSANATTNSSGGISSLTTAINKLQVKENAANTQISSNPAVIPASTSVNLPPAIDLSAALATNHSTHQGTPPSRIFHNKHKQRQQQAGNAEIDFKIPFIDCDRLDASSTKVLLTTPANEYCQIDISHVPLKPNCVQKPSAVGYFLSLVDKHYMPPPQKFANYSTTSAVKHEIKPFDFNTKSPDDLVLASLEKYQRRHFH